MKRTADATASSFDFNSNCAYPPTISLASVKGPSVTVTLPPESRTRAPSAVGPSPPPPSMEPFLLASSLSFEMASINSLGGGPERSADLTIIMNFIILSPLWWEPGFHTASVSRDKKPSSVEPSNETQRNGTQCLEVD